MPLPASLSPLSVSEHFKAAFRAHPAGVAVITATGSEGVVGLTASSVASVSADPPILAFSVSGGRSASQIAAAQTVVVHLLGSDQLELARIFAIPGTPRFTGRMEWEMLPTGEPLLKGVPWALRCEIVHRAALGGSVLLAATVLGVRAEPSGSAPLVYQDRAFHGLSPIEDVS
ncbi:flavin reductase family protein [Pseudarthrobacter sp. J75]|uniref:flavin reductase family protein n=1 Tax=unclassified Pseudarthrobacter TaxID=2647000 RepID=UPI002E7FE413|nr:MULTISPECIES: flavin reductase family protein [unclassified Pseudarthrobacter]MEE2523778.1 flavin reductase family protein [Pseudarthrobacter sp. J47]MEE2529944.1 flavin reductase family protein [Pseudarthrobacter sp. J75]